MSKRYANYLGSRNKPVLAVKSKKPNWVKRANIALFALVLPLVILGAGYAIWDNSQVKFSRFCSSSDEYRKGFTWDNQVGLYVAGKQLKKFDVRMCTKATTEEASVYDASFEAAADLTAQDVVSHGDFESSDEFTDFIHEALGFHMEPGAKEFYFDNPTELRVENLVFY